MIRLDGIEWWRIDFNKPPEDTLLMLTGKSGMGRYEQFLVFGYYDNEFRPPYDNGDIRWLDIHNDALLDHGYRPTHWAYPIKLPKINTQENRT